MIRFAPLIAAALALSACDSASGPVTTTKLNAVEVEPGTASDAMIMLDDSDVDGTAVDTSGALTTEGAAVAKAEAEKAAPAAEPPAENDSADEDAPATKTEEQ